MVDLLHQYYVRHCSLSVGYEMYVTFRELTFLSSPSDWLSERAFSDINDIVKVQI
jgi:hypothetical protein